MLLLLLFLFLPNMKKESFAKEQIKPS